MADTVASQPDGHGFGSDPGLSVVSLHVFPAPTRVLSGHNDFLSRPKDMQVS